MTDKEKLDILLPAVYSLLKSHSWFTQREYERDSKYNNESVGYKEEEKIINVLTEIHGDNAWLMEIM